MAKYTLTIREILESFQNPQVRIEYYQIADLVSLGREKLFDFSYPIFDETYREVIETKFLYHFLFREISDTPFYKWKMYLNRTFKEEMPYFNQLYQSEKLKFDVFNNVDITTNHDGTNKVDESKDRQVNGNSDTTTDGFSLDMGTDTTTEKLRMSETPQGSLADLESGLYMTQGNVNDYDVRTDHRIDNNNKVRMTRDEVTTDGRKLQTTDSWTETILGKNNSVTNSEALMKFRESFLNIDMLVLNKMEVLFFCLY